MSRLRGETIEVAAADLFLKHTGMRASQGKLRPSESAGSVLAQELAAHAPRCARRAPATVRNPSPPRPCSRAGGAGRRDLPLGDADRHAPQMRMPQHGRALVDAGEGDLCRVEPRDSASTCAAREVGGDGAVGLRSVGDARAGWWRSAGPSPAPAGRRTSLQSTTHSRSFWMEIRIGVAVARSETRHRVRRGMRQSHSLGRVAMLGVAAAASPSTPSWHRTWRRGYRRPRPVRARAISASRIAS